MAKILNSVKFYFFTNTINFNYRFIKHALRAYKMDLLNFSYVSSMLMKLFTTLNYENDIVN
jgi:hypothetical protein